jgi:non-canonical (house-cleaning) NTP pyrophosphatase
LLAKAKQAELGMLSRDLLTRSMSFEAALIAAFAPFYDREMFGLR